MEREAFEERQDLPTTRTGGRRDRQQNLLGTGHFDQPLQLIGVIHLQACNDTISDTGIVINERDGTHGLVHAQGGHQLITRSTSAVDSDLRQAVFTTGKGHVLDGSSEPVAQEVLTHGQAQPANHDQA
ncbi:hypothetical protein D3C76_1248660 [compost metagenome]